MTEPGVLLLFRDFSPIYRRNLIQMTQTARACGLHTVVLTEPGVAIPEQAQVGQVEVCQSLADVREVIRVATRVAEQVCIKRVFALFELDVYTAACVRRSLGVAGASPAVALCFRNKTVMHTRAAELGIGTPRCCLPLTWKRVTDLSAEVGFPLVFKPNDGHGSMNTTRVETLDQLRICWEAAGSEPERYRIEEYVDGAHYHVDSVIRDGVIVFEVISRYTANLLNYEKEPGGTVTRCMEQTPAEKSILAANRQLISGFELEMGITHGEYFFTADGQVCLGEIGARPPGGSILPTIEEATGVSLVRTWAAAEMDPNFVAPKACPGEAATRFLATWEYGHLQSVTSREELLAREGVVQAELWKKPGDVIGSPTRSSDYLGYIIARGTSSVEAVRRVDAAAASFKVVADGIPVRA